MRGSNLAINNVVSSYTVYLILDVLYYTTCMHNRDAERKLESGKAKGWVWFQVGGGGMVSGGGGAEAVLICILSTKSVERLVNCVRISFVAAYFAE